MKVQGTNDAYCRISEGITSRMEKCPRNFFDTLGEYCIPKMCVYAVEVEEDEEHYYDEEEIIENCTVQILRNTETGETSIGWWKND